MLRRWLTGGLMVGLLASGLLAKPGIVRIRDGSTFQGDVTEDEKSVKIKIGKITTQIDRRNVTKIEYTATLEDQLNDRKKKLAPDDVKGRIDLAKWASENQRPDLAAGVLQEATKIDPANREAALALDTAQRQMDLDARQGKGKTPPPNGAAPNPGNAANPPAVPDAAAGPGGGAATPTTNKADIAERRLLTNDEVNTIRQKEMSASEANLRILFEKDVIKRYLATGDHDAAQFHKLSPTAQAVEIISSGDAKMANDVRIMTDPQAIVEFKQKVYPVVAQGCASSGCHGGTHGGNFGVFPGESPNALYSNFYMLQKYAKTIKGVEYIMLDRTIPERSLFLQYSLPAELTDAAHPKAPNFRPRFHARSEAGYKEVLDWLTNGLKPIAPDYGIKVSAVLPATQPAGHGEAGK